MVLSTFVEPFYEGGAQTARAVPRLWPVALDGEPFLIEPREYRRVFIPAQRPATFDQTEPGENSLNPEGLWRRSQSDWALGAGQIWLDAEESERRRFAASKGIDPWGDRELVLLPDTEQKRPSVATNLRLGVVEDYLYVLDGEDLLFGTDPTPASWSAFTTATGLPAGDLLDVATTGQHVYVLASDSTIYRATPGTTGFTSWYNATALLTRLWFAGGRLIASDGRTLYEITAIPGEVEIFEHPQPGFVWSDVLGTPNGMYAAGNSADRGQIYYTTVKDDGSAFEVPVVAAELRREPVHVLAGVGGVVVAGTDLGIRVASVAETRLLFGPVIVAPGPVHCLTVDVIEAETFVWFGWSDYDADSTGLGRLRLARFTGDLVPAYASDVLAPTQGTVTGAVSFQGRRYFGVAEDGFWGTVDELVATGTLTTGRIRFGLVDNKVFTDLTWRTAPLVGDVAAVVDYDDGANLPITSQFAQGSVTPGLRSLGNYAAEWAELTWTLSRHEDDPTIGPTLRWWLLRAIPAPQLIQRILLPVILRAELQLRGGTVVNVDVERKFDFLKRLVLAQRVVRYQEGNTGEDVYVANLQQQPEQWDPRAHVLEGLVMVELHTLR